MIPIPIYGTESKVKNGDYIYLCRDYIVEIKEHGNRIEKRYYDKLWVNFSPNVLKLPK